MNGSVIHDGYVLEETLPPLGPWPALHFRYRPALPEDVMEFQYQRDLAQGKTAMKPIGEFIARHLKGWDVKNKQGEVVPYTAEYVRTIPYPRINQILDHITGYAGSQAVQDEKNSATASA